MLGKRLLAWQIHRFVNSDPVFAHYSHVEDQSLHPGVKKETVWTPFTQSQRGHWRKTFSTRVRDIGERRWKRYWYGVPYEDAAEVYRRENSQIEAERKSVEPLLLDLNAQLPDDILEVVDKYYKTIRRVMSKDGWRAADVLKEFDVIPWSPFDVINEVHTEREGIEEGEGDVEDKGSSVESVHIDEQELFGEEINTTNIESLDAPATPQRSTRGTVLVESEPNTPPQRTYESPPGMEGRLFTSR